MFERDGLRDMMNAAKDKKFDVLIVESLDRISRDQEDMAGIFKRFKFWEVEINCVNEGVATDLHVGIRGIVSSLFLKDLAHKVKRGMTGRAREGKIPTRPPFGYKAVPGKPGEPEIDEAQANTVRRIFREYAEGMSPRAIAAGLTRDKVESPSGGIHWNNQTFTGGGNGRKRGIISNPIYIGELVWNTHRQITNPDTGRKTIRLNDEKEVIKASVPHLRIVDQKLWDAAQRVRADRSVAKFGPERRNKRKVTPRKAHLLSGLLQCEACGGPMFIRGGSAKAGRVACVAASTKRTCTHSKTYDILQLQEFVLKKLRQIMGDEEMLARLEAGWMDRLRQGKRPDPTALHAAQKELNQITVQIDRVVNAITTMDTPVKQLTDKLDQLEQQRAGLAERVRLLEIETNVITLHPTAIRDYKKRMVEFLQNVTGTETDEVQQTAFRMLIDRIIVHVTGKRMPYEVTALARMAADANLTPPTRTSTQVLEDSGIPYVDSANLSNRELAVSTYNVISLGRWKEAA